MSINPSGRVRRRRSKSLRVGEITPADRGLGDVVLYESKGAELRLEVRLEKETVWLTQGQMAELFRRDRSVVARHIANVFEEGELDEESNVQKMHITSSDRPITLYSLDVVVSVGYRVKSPQGTQFRVWATRVLKGHLVRGYTLNEQRLRERGFTEVRQAVALLGRTLTQNDLVTDEGRAVLQVIEDYSRTWHLLLAYDENRLEGTVCDPREPQAELSTCFQALVRRNPAFQDKTAVDASVELFNRMVGIIDGQLGLTGTYIAGERFTVADIAIGLSLHRWRSVPMPRPPYANVDRYFDRLLERPGFVRYGRDCGP